MLRPVVSYPLEENKGRASCSVLTRHSSVMMRVYSVLLCQSVSYCIPLSLQRLRPHISICLPILSRAGYRIYSFLLGTHSAITVPSLYTTQRAYKQPSLGPAVAAAIGMGASIPGGRPCTKQMRFRTCAATVIPRYVRGTIR